MKRLDLARQLSNHHNHGLETHRKVIDHFLEEIAAALEHGNRVEIRGFGVFEVRNHNKRVSHNPISGDPILLPDRVRPRFRCAAILEKRLNRDS